MTARVLVLSGVMVAGQVPAAFADGSLVQSAIRMAERAGRQAATSLPPRAPAARSAAAQGGNLASSGMSKGKKWLVAIAAGLGVAGAMYAIDHSVLDNTPSSLGTRKD